MKPAAALAVAAVSIFLTERRALLFVLPRSVLLSMASSIPAMQKANLNSTTRRHRQMSTLCPKYVECMESHAILQKIQIVTSCNVQELELRVTSRLLALQYCCCHIITLRRYTNLICVIGFADSGKLRECSLIKQVKCSAFEPNVRNFLVRSH